MTFGLDHQFSQIDTLSLDYGRSEIVETFDALPGVENVLTSPVLNANFTREMVNGSAGASFRSNLTNQGRQNTLQFRRSLELPNGSLSFSFGVAEGETFEPRPIGSLRYETQGHRSTFAASVLRTAQISDTLSRATENTRLNLEYTLALTEVSGLSLDFLYGDISVLGIDDAQAARERSSLYASYNHAITEDWDVVVGYEARYFAPDVGPSSTTGGVFFTFRRDFESYR